MTTVLGPFLFSTLTQSPQRGPTLSAAETSPPYSVTFPCPGPSLATRLGTRLGLTPVSCHDSFLFGGEVTRTKQRSPKPPSNEYF